ncbi:MAG TPA: TonB family protein [Candidatus Angelobacter sp.]
MPVGNLRVPQQPPGLLVSNFHFLLEPEPWLKNFLDNLSDVFRAAPPQPRLTSRPGRYWPDALVNRPVAWAAMRKSYLGHALVLLAGYGLNLLWLSRPQVIEIETPQTTVSHYELSPYLPAVNAEAQKPEPPVRERAQKADPEYAQQEIVSLHNQPDSLRQTIVTPSPNLLRQDVPLPNLVASSAAPVAPVAHRERFQSTPVEAVQVVPPAQQAAERGASRLIFPVPPAQVVPPPNDVATSHVVPALPLNGPLVIPPAQVAAARDASRLQLPPQAPDVAGPASSMAQRKAMAQALPLARPEVVPPAQNTGARNLASLPVPAPAQSVVPPAPAASMAQRNFAGIGVVEPAQTVVPPAQPIATGAHASQLLALNVQPVAPVGPVSVPEGNRRGEFAAGPAGRTGATAVPESRAGDNSSAASEPANLFVAPPPNKIVADAVVASPPAPLKPSTLLERTDVPADRIDNQVFGTRRHYAIKLSMPNINSAMGSWIIRFAELHPDDPTQQDDLSTPEPLRKVDPAYPASMVRDRIEGVVVLHAIIRSDGAVTDVRVLEGFDERLDENARSALSQWRFRPGTRNGVPVDVEAVVRVPFRAPKPAF